MGEFAAVVAVPQVGVGVQGHHRQVRVAGLGRLDQGRGDGVFAPQGGDEFALGNPGLHQAADLVQHGLGTGNLREDRQGGGERMAWLGSQSYCSSQSSTCREAAKMASGPSLVPPP